jgi:ketosteroid isomerase-like protein
LHFRPAKGRTADIQPSTFNIQMKKLIVLFLALAALRSAHSSETPDPTAEIRAVMDAQVEAWNRADIDGYMQGYVHSDKLEFVSGGKITRGWQTVRDRYQRKYDSPEKMGTLAFSDIKVSSLNASHAVVQGRWSLRRRTDRPHGTFVLIFRRLPQGWRIVHDQTD